MDKGSSNRSVSVKDQTFSLVEKLDTFLKDKQASYLSNAEMIDILKTFILSFAGFVLSMISL